MYLKTRQKANKRYQRTYQGRLNHAARQKRYRERLKYKVTYQASNIIPLCDLLNKERKYVIINFKLNKKRKFKEVFCHCCSKSCLPFLRDGYLSDLNQYREYSEVYKEKVNHFLRTK